MIAAPERFLADFARAGADGLTVHVEACPDLRSVVAQITALGKWAGVALNPPTPASAVADILGEVDLVLAMTVNPGFAGQAFMPEVMSKVRQLREMIDARGLAVELEVDGGIDRHTALQAAEAGATVFVAASAIFKSEYGITGGIHSLYRKLSPQAP
jgi:ribulose-phosphate 3-epimerase